MSELDQSFIRIHENDDGNFVIVYGASTQEDHQSINLESIVIDYCDAELIARCLLNMVGKADKK